MAKISKEDVLRQQVLHTEHPEDRRMREEGERYGKAHAAEFCAQYEPDMLLLIATYADREAHELLDRLREMFWAEHWKPKKHITKSEQGR